MTRDKSILIKNIYYMLSYAFTALDQGDYEDIALEEFENVHNLFAAILAKGIGRQLKQGLYREYLNRKEDIAVVRGKIDMPGTIRNRLARKLVLTCEYDELSENNLLNQILKTTAMLLLRHARVDQEYKDDLKKELLFFSNVETVDPGAVRWTSIHFQRNNRTYRMLISLCQLILEGMLLTTDSGEYKLASFIDQQRMSRLYEKFILEYYAKEWPQVKATASQIPWALDDGLGTMLPVMQTDVMLSKGSEVLIIDANYYTHTTQIQYDVHTLHSANLYQIFTYVKNKDMEFGDEPHTVSGMLLYAATDEAVQPNNSYLMSGNKIGVRTLDLNRDFSEIAAQLNAIVEEHFFVNSAEAHTIEHTGPEPVTYETPAGKTGPTPAAAYKPPVTATPPAAEEKAVTGKASQQDAPSGTPGETGPAGVAYAPKDTGLSMPKLYVGMKVTHGKFGEGVVKKIFVNEKKITVSFAGGEKDFVTDEKSDMDAFRKGFLKVKE